METVGLIVFGVACLLGAFSLLMPLAERLNWPYTVTLALFGVVVGTLLLLQVEVGGVVGVMLSGLRELRLPADGFLFIFLPVLLFSAGLNIDVRRLMDDIGAVTLLAVVAVVVCTFFAGAGLAVVTGVPIVACLLLGAIVATTDSAAVLAIFHDLGAPKRLLNLVEGESLFNDAAAIALYTVLFGILTGVAEPSILDGINAFLVGMLGGVVVGYLFGKAFAMMIGRMRDMIMAEVTMTVALAYLTYYVADVYIGVSGVIAVVTAAMIFASEGRMHLSPGAWGLLRGMWRMLDFWATSLIFILGAMLAPRALGVIQSQDVLVFAVLFGTTILARFVILFGFFPLLTRAGLGQPISGSYKLMLGWGGLRGAVTIALALAISENPLVDPEIQRFIFVGATGYVLLTLFLQAPTLRPLMQILKLDNLTLGERMIRDRVQMLSRLHIREQMREIASDIGMRSSDADQETEIALGMEVEDGGADEIDMSTEDKLQVALLAVSNREAELGFDYLQRGIINRNIAEIMRAHSGRLLDAAKVNGLEGYSDTAFGLLGMSRSFRLGLWLQRRFGIEDLLANNLADRFEVFLVNELALPILIRFADNEVRELVGAETAGDIKKLLEMRLQTIADALDALSLQFPSYSESVRKRYLERVALGLEEAQYRQQLQQSLISPEVFDDLEKNRRNRQHALDQRPELDLGLRLTQMISKVPLFAEVEKSALEKIGRELAPQLAVPDEHIIADGDRGKCMYFIATGDVDVVLGSRTVRLSSGDYFGEMALLDDSPRNAEVIARSYCHLMTLDRKDFQRLCKDNETLRNHIEATAEARRGERLL